MNQTQPKYLEQYDRMLRWYERFKSINDGREHTVNSYNYLDEIHAFFMSCYHLKDWIKHDQESLTLGRGVENYIKAHESLKISADICNGVKHLLLSTPKMGIGGANLGNQHITLTIGEGEPIVSIKYKIIAEGKEYDAFKVATDAVGLWKKYLNLP